MTFVIQNPGFILPLDATQTEVPRKDFGRKSSNLEQSIQRIKVRKSLLMAEICSEEKPKYKSQDEENHNQQSQLDRQLSTTKIPMTDGLLPPGGVYICDECNRNERTPFQLCEHKAIYHSPREQRVWKCVYCNTIFGRRGGLRRHVQMVHMQMMHKCPIENCTHPGYKCTKALNAHVRTHTRPYACDKCDACFARKPDLQNHLNTHQQNFQF